MFHIGHAVDYGQPLEVDAVESIGLSHLGGDGCHTAVDKLKRFAPAKVVEEKCFETVHCLLACLATHRTCDVAVVACEKFVENMHAQISCGASEKHIADGLSVSLAESVEIIGLENRCVGVIACILNSIGRFFFWSDFSGNRRLRLLLCNKLGKSSRCLLVE